MRDCHPLPARRRDPTSPLQEEMTRAPYVIAPPPTGGRVSFDIRRHPNRDHAIRILNRLALLDLVDDVHAGQNLADYGVLTIKEGAVRIHNEELAVGGVVAVALAGHADDAALEGHLGEFRLQVGIFRAAGAIAVLPVTGLRHKACDHPME